MPWICGILLLLVSQLGFSVAAAEDDVGQKIVDSLMVASEHEFQGDMKSRFYDYKNNDINVDEGYQNERSFENVGSEVGLDREEKQSGSCSDSYPNGYSWSKCWYSCAKWKARGACWKTWNQAASGTCKTSLGWWKNQKINLYCSITCNTCSNGAWAAWGAWSTCSEACGDGTQSRSRSCSGAWGTGASCTNNGGSASDSQTCNLGACVIDGHWAEWGTWSSCPVTCGGGNLTRTRDCDMDVSGDHVSGAHCSTDGSTGEEYQACGDDPCPINGAWGQWEAWSFDCPVTCEAGNYSHSRRRKCDSPAPQYGGDNCTANGSNDTDTQQCNTDPCPIHGDWSAWGNWSTCSKTCGTGQQERTRICIEPKNGGDSCIVDGSLAYDRKSCTNGTCPESCDDGIQNQGETGVDCGIICSTPCETCFDYTKNQNEKGVDCGGICYTLHGKVCKKKPKGPKQVPTRWGNPSSKCSNDWSRNKCSKKMRRGKCTKSWVQKKCKATCRVCCGDIWSEKRCVPRFKGCGKSKRVTNNCRRTCLKC